MRLGYLVILLSLAACTSAPERDAKRAASSVHSRIVQSDGNEKEPTLELRNDGRASIRFASPIFIFSKAPDSQPCPIPTDWQYEMHELKPGRVAMLRIFGGTPPEHVGIWVSDEADRGGVRASVVWSKNQLK